MGTKLRNVVIVVGLLGAFAGGTASAESLNPYAQARGHMSCLEAHPGAVVFCAAREDRRAIREIKRRARLEVRRTHAHVKIHARPMIWDPVKLDRANHWQRRNLRRLQSMPTWHSTDPLTAGRELSYEAGWTHENGQWDCLYSLWNRESGWSTPDTNASSGAAGIPQALPPSKMGDGWAEVDGNGNATARAIRIQVLWGIGYIKARYGDACSAWGHSNAYNWY